MKTASLDSSWMPPIEEWDFRAVTERECALACYWEYTRSLILLPRNPNSWIHKSSERLPIISKFSIGMSVPPAPWTTIGMAVRGPLLFYYANPKVVRIQQLGDLVRETMQRANGNPWRALELLSATEADVVWIDFRKHGLTEVMKGLKGWARRQSKNTRIGMHGKSASPPFACLKWLSAWRLDRARKRAGKLASDVQRCLAEYKKQSAQPDPQDVIPSYPGAAAWSKAVSDAKDLLHLHETDSYALSFRFLTPGLWKDYARRQGFSVR